MITWLGRDVILVGMSYRAAAIAAKGRGHAVADPSKTPLKVNPSFISKVNTVFQFGTISLGLGLAAFPDYTMMIYSDIDIMTAICGVTCGTTIWSGVGFLYTVAKLKTIGDISYAKICMPACLGITLIF